MDEKYKDDESWWTEDSKESIGKYFDPKDIAADIRHISVDYILRKIDYGDIDLLPRFQRRYDLWNDSMKSQLLESILLNFPVPALYFDSNSFDHWVVIDGLQRLWTLKSFVVDSQFRLRGLTVLVHLNGFNFSELERQYQRKILEYTLVVYLIRPGAPRFAIYDIFRRLNTTGVTLNSQEVRHALNPQGSEFLDDLIKHSNLKRILRTPKKRMEDAEIVLRFISFYITDYNLYQPPMSLFLDRTMEFINSGNDRLYNNIYNDFNKAINFLQEIFRPEGLFITNSKISRRFNKALFEVWTVIISMLSSNEIDKLKRNKDLLLHNYNDLLNNNVFIESITTATASKKAVINRFTLLEELIKRSYD